MVHNITLNRALQTSLPFGFFGRPSCPISSCFFGLRLLSRSNPRFIGPFLLPSLTLVPSVLLQPCATTTGMLFSSLRDATPRFRLRSSKLPVMSSQILNWHISMVPLEARS